MLMGLVASAVLAHGDAVKGARDGRARPAPRPGRHRRQLGLAALHVRHAELSDGIGFTVIAVGLFAVAEMRQPRVARAREVFTGTIPS
jgi:hypothetical protein